MAVKGLKREFGRIPKMDIIFKTNQYICTNCFTVCDKKPCVEALYFSFNNIDRTLIFGIFNTGFLFGGDTLYIFNICRIENGTYLRKIEGFSHQIFRSSNMLNFNSIETNLLELIAHSKRRPSIHIYLQFS